MIALFALGCRNEGPPSPGRIPPVLDLLGMTTDAPGLMRVYGSDPVRGIFGVPVAGGRDVDGDSLPDVALSTMRASPQGREAAGVVHLVFGTGAVQGAVDTADDPQVLAVQGAAALENAGSEIWMGDVTGDGLAELLVARQNAQVQGVDGAGAVSILVGGAALRGLPSPLDLAAADLGAADPAVTVTTLGGAQAFGRVGIWVRTGDATGDGIDDLLIGADQEDGHTGAAWLVEGGAHLAVGGEHTLADPDGLLVGHVLRILGPGVLEAHFGGTIQLADLDGSGAAELLIASTLNRAGASLEAAPVPEGEEGRAHGKGGVPHGSVTILWDDAVPALPWAAGQTVDSRSPALAGVVSTLTGTLLHNSFGEEMVAGDWDGDGATDLFVGDLVSDLSANAGRSYGGVGMVLYSIGQEPGADLSMDDPPDWLATSVLLGAYRGDLFSDTAVSGDFTGDGVDDLVATSPDADPADRLGAGLAALLVGGQRWPAVVDLRHDLLPPADEVELIEIWGAQGSRGTGVPGIFDFGDMLAYSASAGDMDADGQLDLISNEMLGNGLQPGTDDVGNLVVIAGSAWKDLVEGQ